MNRQQVYIHRSDGIHRSWKKYTFKNKRLNELLSPFPHKLPFGDIRNTRKPALAAGFLVRFDQLLQKS